MFARRKQNLFVYMWSFSLIFFIFFFLFASLSRIVSIIIIYSSLHLFIRLCHFVKLIIIITKRNLERFVRYVFTHIGLHLASTRFRAWSGLWADLSLFRHLLVVYIPNSIVCGELLTINGNCFRPSWKSVDAFVSGRCASLAIDWNGKKCFHRVWMGNHRNLRGFTKSFPRFRRNFVFASQLS